MRRTMAGLMAETIPSATACRARSALLQWVMCSPSATGSKQASSTIWARWRGGNLRGAPAAGEVGQESRQATLFIAAAEAPDGGRVTAHPRGDLLHPLPPGA